MKEAVFQTDKWPHTRVVCYSCSLGGVELQTAVAEDEMGGITEAQLYFLESIAKTHDRSKHRGLGNIRLERYERVQNTDG